MQNATPALVLTSAQKDVLAQDVGAPIDALYAVDNDSLGIQSLVAAYTDGYWLIFFEGDRSAHLLYIKALFGNDFIVGSYEVISRGIHAYGGPLARFRTANSRAAISTAS